MRIETKDSIGNPNGWVLPIWNALEAPELRPDQVYVTAIAPGSRKGPHLHKVRRGFFAVISGKVIVIIRSEDGIYRLPDVASPIEVNPGEACALYNAGEGEAIVLNLPSPAWSKENPDEWPVDDWQDFEGWERVRRCACGHPTSDHDSGGCCRVMFCECQEIR